MTIDGLCKINVILTERNVMHLLSARAERMTKFKRMLVTEKCSLLFSSVLPQDKLYES